VLRYVFLSEHSFSMRFSGMLNKWESGPSSFSVSFRFCMSVLFITPMSGLVAV